MTKYELKFVNLQYVKTLNSKQDDTMNDLQVAPESKRLQKRRREKPEAEMALVFFRGKFKLDVDKSDQRKHDFRENLNKR